MQNRRTKFKIFFTVATILFLIGVFYYVNVDNTITSVDKIYIQKILSSGQVEAYKNNNNFRQQITFIKAVQKSVLDISPHTHGIAYYHTREPKDVYTLHQGSCYDKSRSIEKILRMNGFDTHHIAVYSTLKTHSKWKALIKKQVRSHAVTEVLTSKGWLIVDSRSTWISLNKFQHVETIAEIKNDIKKHKIAWSRKSYKKMNTLLKQPFTYVIGLYSRTGKLYPPYPAPFPNINWHEFMYNFSL